MSTVTSILVASIVVLGGLAALVKAIWKVAKQITDNTSATRDLTGKMDTLTTNIDGRFDELAARVAALEKSPARRRST